MKSDHRLIINKNLKKLLLIGLITGLVSGIAGIFAGQIGIILATSMGGGLSGIDRFTNKLQVLGYPKDLIFILPFCTYLSGFLFSLSLFTLFYKIILFYFLFILTLINIIISLTIYKNMD